MMDVLHGAGGADMRMIKRLLRAQDGSGRNHRLAQRVDCLLRGAAGAPAPVSACATRDILTVIKRRSSCHRPGVQRPSPPHP
jgi:hypothetical protein